jgi:hypothetical protein
VLLTPLLTKDTFCKKWGAAPRRLDHGIVAR